MKIQVSELIVKYMEQLGIDTIFGMPGAHILPVYDALYDSSIQSVLAKHEQGAAFMAGGYSRASCKIGACITTAGPGATNLVTGIANAFADKQPILAITGEAPTYIFGKGGLQESSGEGGSIDQSAIFSGITRYNKIVERTDYLENVLNSAAKILLADNPGPVLISLPYNVQKEMVDDSILDNIQTEKQLCSINKDSSPIQKFTELLQAANKPVIIAGFGCIRAGAQTLVEEFSSLMNIPVTTSLKGKGVISEQSSLSLGSLGVTSYSQAYEYITDESDLLIFLGAGFNERTSYLWDKTLIKDRKIIQVDVEPGQLEKVFKADIAIQGDIKEVMAAVVENSRAKGLSNKVFDRTSLTGIEKQGQKGNTQSDATIFKEKFPLVKNLFEKLEEYYPAGITVFDDNIIFAQNFFNVSSANRYYPNSGISSLGHAIPAAIGAQFSGKRPMFVIIGDGGFQMCCMEIMTAINYDIPLNIIMFNNSTMGLIRKNQFQQYDQRFIDCDFINPDYAYFAKSFGINHSHVATQNDLDALFTDTDFTSGINLVEFMIDKNAFPNYSSRR